MERICVWRVGYHCHPWKFSETGSNGSGLLNIRGYFWQMMMETVERSQSVGKICIEISPLASQS